MPRNAPASQFPAATSMFPTAPSGNVAQPNFSSHAAPPTKPIYNHAPVSANEPNAKFSQPVGYTRPVSQPATFTQVSKPVSASPVVPEAATVDARPLPPMAPSYGAQQPSTVSYAQIPSGAQYSSVGASQRTQPPNARPVNPTYPTGAPTNPGAPFKGVVNAPFAAAPNAPVYQNVALGQSAQSAPGARSHLQSPYNGRPNMNSTHAQMPPPANKQYSAPHSGFPNYPPAGQEREQYSSQAPGMHHQQPTANHMYEMNGHQTGAVGQHPGPGYGQQYSSVPPQMSSRYPGVSAIFLVCQGVTV